MLVAALLAAGLAHATPPPIDVDARPPPTLRAVRARRPVALDGKGDDEVWRRAPHSDNLVVRRPAIGATPKYETTFQVAFDEHALYVLIRCEAPGGGVARTFERDSFRIFGDDTLSVKIDPRRDYRTGYSFAVNAAGAQFDAIAFNDGNSFIGAWDGVWDAETYRYDEGFNVEVRIPFSIIGVPEGEELTLGFNITRDTHEGETWDWSLLAPPLSPMATSRFGAVVGVDNPAAGKWFAMFPYALARLRSGGGLPEIRLDPRALPMGAFGGEIRGQVAESTYAEVSVLTDFAEVEADTLQVQTGRFPLFFPEQRQFFLSGLDVFDFGLDGDAQPFFTRRIGLQDGRVVPLLGGAKLYGRAGPWAFGVLEATTLPGAKADGLDLPFSESSLVARTKLQASRQVTLGALALGRATIDDGARPPAHATGGADMRLVAFNSRLRVYSFGLATMTPTPDGDSGRPGYSSFVAAEWQGQYARPAVDFLWSDDRFDPQLGFYQRPGTARVRGALPLAYQPSMLGLREVSGSVYGSVTLTPTLDETLTRSLSWSLNAGWANGASASFGMTRTIDAVAEAFTVFGSTIAAATYDTNTAFFGVSSPQVLPATLSLSGQWGGVYGGAGGSLSATAQWRSSRFFYLLATGTQLLGDLGGGRRYAFTSSRLEAIVSPTRDIAWTTKAQLLLAPGDEQAVVQSRLRWRYRQSSDVFLVYRYQQPLRPRRGVAGQPRPDHTLNLKVTYYLPSTWL
jgi:hypothetical protein